jgi:hypothetical protein
MREVWIASIAAVAVQPLVFLLRLLPVFLYSSTPIYGLGFVVIAVVVVSAAFVLVLGIPMFLFLRRRRGEGWVSLSIAGFLAGAVPFALLSWPRAMSGYSSGSNWHGHYVDMYIQGVPTVYAWESYAENVAYCGLHGLIGAIVFFAIWRRVSAP